MGGVMRDELFAKLAESLKQAGDLGALEDAGLTLAEAIEVCAMAGMRFRVTTVGEPHYTLTEAGKAALGEG